MHVYYNSCFSCDHNTVSYVDRKHFVWICPSCEREALPLYNADSSIWSHPSTSTSTATAPELQTHSHTHLTKILTINARSVLPKMDEPRSLCAALHPAAIVVTETWLSSCVFDNEVLINGYNLVRTGRIEIAMAGE